MRQEGANDRLWDFFGRSGWIVAASSAARSHTITTSPNRDADVQIVDVDLAGDRKLILQHRVLDGIVLEEGDAERVLQHVADLWGYDVKLLEQDDAGTVRAEHTTTRGGRLRNRDQAFIHDRDLVLCAHELSCRFHADPTSRTGPRLFLDDDLHIPIECG